MADPVEVDRLVLSALYLLQEAAPGFIMNDRVLTDALTATADSDSLFDCFRPRQTGGNVWIEALLTNLSQGGAVISIGTHYMWYGTNTLVTLGKERFDHLPPGAQVKVRRLVQVHLLPLVTECVQIVPRPQPKGTNPHG